MLSDLIVLTMAAITRWRRRHPGRRHRLQMPVVSIGNISMGGRGKSPMAELVVRGLLDAGERPAILSRGYARERTLETPLVVRDADGVRAGVAESGDEPLMLAEALEGAIVVVHPDRGRAGAIAEEIGATIHVLDDGFQHLRLERDIDIVMIHPKDLDDRVLPAGRLREPVDALGALTDNDAIVLIDGVRNDRSSAALRVAEISEAPVFTALRHVEPPPATLAGAQVFLVSGIADSGQLTQSLAAAGWSIAGERAFPDHHRYSRADAEDVARAASALGAPAVLTTAKDAVRLRAVWGGAMPLHVARMALAIDGTFHDWLIERVTRVRDARAREQHRARRDGERRAS